MSVGTSLKGTSEAELMCDRLNGNLVESSESQFLYWNWGLPWRLSW